MGLGRSVLPQVSICACLVSPSLQNALRRLLPSDRYALHLTQTSVEFLRTLNQLDPPPDCLVLEDTAEMADVLMQLRQRSRLLPAVLITRTTPPLREEALAKDLAPVRRYHPAETCIADTHLEDLNLGIEQAIAQFLRLSPHAEPPPKPHSNPTAVTSGFTDLTDLSDPGDLLEQQRRLATKLRERLGYLGVYYKRDSRRFLRYLPPTDAQELLSTLKRCYQEIVLNYFLESAHLNQMIDEFASLAFFADLSVPQIVEIHMELMDEYAKQLKLEGRNEAILTDYRLTLLDVVAHLCEMYRRSIPRES